MLYFYDDPPVWIPTQCESARNTINHLCAPSRGKRVRLNNPVSGIPRSARFIAQKFSQKLRTRI